MKKKTYEKPSMKDTEIPACQIIRLPALVCGEKD